MNENESPDSDNEPDEIYNETNENDHFIYSIKLMITMIQNLHTLTQIDLDSTEIANLLLCS